MKAETRNLVVLLTATIAPGQVPYLKRADAAVRRRDYIEAFGKWLATRAASGIVFCDNSAAPVDDLERMASAGGTARPVEVLTFAGQQDVDCRGKGFGEIGIIRHAIENSALLARADVIMKVTGRLFVRNADALIARAGRIDADVLCDLRQNLQIADSRVFCGTREFVKNFLLPRAGEVDDSGGSTFEVVLARAVHRAMSEGARWAMLPVVPDIEGIAATADVPYKRRSATRWGRALFRACKERILER